MRYIELLIQICLLCFCFVILSNGIRLYKDLSIQCYEYRNKTDAKRFISESFINTCNGKGFDSLFTWQKTCKAMWNLDYIGWCNGDKIFSNETMKNKNIKTILYGKWIKGKESGEVYWQDIYEK